jgi:hypothetical protein
MLARLQVKYGQVPKVVEIMSHITPALEKEGWTLIGGYQTVIGRFHEVWDLWDVGGDAAAIGAALDKARLDPDFAEWAAKLPDVVESEETRYMEKLPYSH